MTWKQDEIVGFCQEHSWVWENFPSYFLIASYWTLLTNSLPWNSYSRKHENPAVSILESPKLSWNQLPKWLRSNRLQKKKELLSTTMKYRAKQVKMGNMPQKKRKKISACLKKNALPDLNCSDHYLNVKRFYALKKYWQDLNKLLTSNQEHSLLALNYLCEQCLLSIWVRGKIFKNGTMASLFFFHQ